MGRNLARADRPCFHLTMATRAWMSWSSGKDSTFALQCVAPGIEVTKLVVTVNEEADRVAMHAVRRSLLELQADRLGLPLHVVPIPSPCSNEVYEARMGEAMDVAVREGVKAMVFGDLFLEDVRRYRERALAPTGIEPVFPLWSRPTDEPAQLSPSFVGRPFDEELLHDLPVGVDHCGERGEFHTFVWDAPSFSSPIPIHTGERVSRDGFEFCDVLPGEAALPG
jgi:diphthamide synthase (EF-2-diphthine--ammonia ligase)